MSVEKDYWGIPALFNDRQFERIFRITRSIAQNLLQRCCSSSLFFWDGYNATKRQAICPKVKLLMALKCLAFGVSPVAFIDYFQMGESTGVLCLKSFFHLLCTDEVLLDMYF
jgi:hypothetical protein